MISRIEGFSGGSGPFLILFAFGWIKVIEIAYT